MARVVLRKVRAHSAVVRVCLSDIAAGVTLLASSTYTWSALAAFVAIGALSSIINATVITAFRSAVPPDVRGPVVALVIGLSTAAVPIRHGTARDTGRSLAQLVAPGVCWQ